MSPVWVVSSVLAWAVIALLVAVLLSLLRQVGELRAALAGFAPGGVSGAQLFDSIEPFTVPLVGTRAGEHLELGGERERPVLLVVHQPGCPGCEGIPAALAALAAEPEAGVDVVSVLALEREEAARAARSPLPTIVAGDLPAALRPDAVPATIGLTRDGVVGALGHAATPTDLRAAARATAGAVATGLPGSHRTASWGTSLPYRDPEPAGHGSRAR